MNNTQILKDGTTTTKDVTSGLLSPEQSKKFLKQTFEATALGGLIRTETRKAKTGEIDKIGIDSRIIRKKTENTDDEKRVKPKFAKVEYATTNLFVYHGKSQKKLFVKILKEKDSKRLYQIL